MTKIQIARIRPKVLTPFSALEEAKRTKYPIVTQKVAGTRLIKKHIGVAR